MHLAVPIPIIRNDRQENLSKTVRTNFENKSSAHVLRCPKMSRLLELCVGKRSIFALTDKSIIQIKEETRLQNAYDT